MLKIVKCAWENSDVSSSVQDFHRLHFEIVTSAAASTPKEVRAYPQRGSGPVSQAHLERGLSLDLVTWKCYHAITYPAYEFGKNMMTSSNGNISELLAICAGKSLVTGEFPPQRPVTRSFDAFFDLVPFDNKSILVEAMVWGRTFEKPSYEPVSTEA